jgi:hypothetical protein
MDKGNRRRRTSQRPSAETANRDIWRLLSDEYLLIIEKKTKSGPLAEERLRDYFAEGRIDRDGRERYKVHKRFVRLGLDGGRPIYTPDDRSFWYSDPLLRVDCKIDPPNSSVHWSGPTVVQDSKCDALVPDYDRMAEYELIEIRLRHDLVVEFMDLPAEPRTVPAESAAPVDPPAASASASSTIKVELPDKIKVQLVDKPASRVRTQPPSQPTEDQIQALMGDVSELSDVEKRIRRYVVIKHRERWGEIDPGRAKTAAKNDPLYEQEVGIIHYEISTWRRALGRKSR